MRSANVTSSRRATQDAAPSYARFTYDPIFSQQTGRTDGDGRRTLIDVDPANGNTRSVTRVVGAVGGADDVVTTFTYTSRGLVDTMTDPLGRITDFDYDARGRLLTLTEAMGTADQGVTRCEYESAGNRTAMIDELGRRTEFVYDAMNRLLRITEADPDIAGPLTSPISTLTFDLAGNVLTTTDARGNATSYEYDALDRERRRTDALLGVETYQYDTQGNVLAVAETIDSAAGAVTSYIYDALDRTVGQIQTGGGTNDKRVDLAYSPIGQLTSIARFTDLAGTQPVVATEHAYDSLNRVTGITHRRGATTIEFENLTYDAASRITRLTDGDGTSDYVYDRDNVLLEFADPDGTGFPIEPAFARRNLQGPAVDQVLAEDSGGGSVLWHLADHLGSTRDLVNNSGVVQNHVVYDSFGRVASQTNPAASSRYLFTGREFEPEFGLYYYRLRFYDPALGRFLSEDPLGFGASDANLFRHVGNSPLARTDPLGLCETASATYVDMIEETSDWVDPLDSTSQDPGPRFRSSPDEPWQPLVAGMDLQGGDEVYTRGSKVVVKVGGTAIMHLETDTVFQIPQSDEVKARERAAFLEKTSLLTLLNPLHQVTAEEYELLNFPRTKDAIGGIKVRGDGTTGLDH